MFSLTGKVLGKGLLGKTLSLKGFSPDSLLFIINDNYLISSLLPVIPQGSKKPLSKIFLKGFFYARATFPFHEI